MRLLRPLHPQSTKSLRVGKPRCLATGSAAANGGRSTATRKLAFLIKQVEISNQTVAAAAASYEEARAVIRQAQAALLPTLTGSYTFTRTMTGPKSLSNQTGSTAALFTGTPIYTTTYNPQLSASWDIDVWGRVRREIESNAAATQATAADLDNAKLSQQALLATAYFNLRATDSLLDLLERTVVQYRKTLNVVRNQFNAGYGPPGSTCCTAADVATAEAQVFTTEAQAKSTAATRAQYEHAIAILIGRPPAELYDRSTRACRQYSKNPAYGSLDTS